MLIMFNNIYNLSSLLYGICHLWFLLMLFGLFILAPIVWFFMERINNDRFATCQWKFSGDKHKSLQVDTERTFHQRYPLVML